MYIRYHFDCIKFNHASDKAECLSVRIKGKVNMIDILVAVSYRQPNQDKASHKWVEEVL